MNMEDINIEVAPRNGKPTRLVVAQFGQDGEYRATFNTDSAISRERFVAKLAGKAGIEDDDLLAKIDRKITKLADDADAEADAADEDLSDSEIGTEERKSQATQLVELAIAARVTLFHDADGVAYARFIIDGHHEIAKVASNQFKRWLARLFFGQTGKAPNSQAKADATGVLEGIALYDGDERAVYVRVAEHEGRIYVDLCNAEWSVVEVDGNGWRIVESPVMFRRAKAMLPLPTPEIGGSVDDLRPFFDVEGTPFILVVAWLLAAIRPRGPYPLLEFDGEQGSGKSTRARMLRCLVDPNSADLRSEPREPRDLMIAASNGHVVALDNLSFLPAWLSDCLCRLSTGGGFSTRTLYENDEETIFNATKPVILTGIEQVASRGDLIDRALLVSLPAIPEHKRKPESELWAAFEAARPRLFGAILTAVSAAIRNLPTTRIASLPRMADFALWISAAESALGWEPGTFMAAYSDNRDEADHLAVESSIIGKALVELLAQFGEWESTPAELLSELEQRAGLADEKKRKPKGWPGNARALSGAIRRICPHLRKIGFEVEDWRDNTAKRSRKITIRRVGESSVRSVRGVQTPGISDDSLDANVPGWTQPGVTWTQAASERHLDRTQMDAADATPHESSAQEEPDEELVEWRSKN
jgi:hypothetical protein